MATRGPRSKNPIGPRTHWIWAWALLALAAVEEAGAQECRGLDVFVRVHSRHNKTGHWQMDLRLERVSLAPGRGAAALLFEARPMVSLCGGRRYDAVQMKLEGPPPPPGPEYVTVPDVGHYRLHRELVTWDEAKRICEAESAHLLIINSETEDQAIQGLLKSEANVSGVLFLGFNDKKSEGNFVTIFGEPLVAVGYQRWEPGQPDGKQTENCGSIFTGTVGLNDQGCDTKIGFICEQRMA